MRCDTCGRHNRSDARFCDGCGTRLDQTVRAPARPAPYTPAHLAEKIVRSRSAIEGERKLVTVVFADVKGSMDLSEPLDPEEWHRVIDRFFEILLEGIHRFEGTVNQFTGDGIMALFGAPIAHEDHARRACFAALHLTETVGLYARELRRERGLSFVVRMGMNSGEVIVGAIGDDLRMDYTAIGHTVGLAQRMEGLAEPGRVYLTEHTAALVEGFFRLEDLGTFEIKGVRDPVRAYELLGLGERRTRFDLSRARGLSRFVGRRDETSALDQALAEAEAGRGQVVGVAGEAGVGKSRLCYEFVERVRAQGIKVFEAHGQPHGRAFPFLPVLELLRGYFGIDELDGPVASRQKIAGSLLLLDEGFRDTLPLVFDFLGVPDPDLPFPQLDQDARLGQLYGVLGHLIRARSDRGPALVLIEDLQWLDEGSEAFLAHLVEAVPGTRTLLLVNFRPEYRPTWTARSYRQLALGPLDEEATAELLEARLGGDPSLRTLPDYVCRRTGGNPFFIEEVVQSLIGSGALVGESGAYRLVGRLHESSVPPTVQAVIGARLDRLGDREKNVLQTAAVIGPEFTQPVLERIAGLPAYELDAALRSLQEAEFLIERTPFPEPEYGFKHPLTQEVAYRSQLGDRRRRIHADVARALEELAADRLDERAALIAHHWDEAASPSEAARWHRRAAEWSAHHDTAAGLRHWRRVWEHVGLLEPTSDADALALASSLGILTLGLGHGIDPTEAEELFHRGRTLAEQRQDQRSLARLLLVYGRYCWHIGDTARGDELTIEAADVAERVGLSGLKLAAAVGLTGVSMLSVDLRRALEVVDEALREPPKNPRLGAEHLGYSPYIWLVMHRGRILCWMGRCAEAAESLERASRLAREHAEPMILVWTHQGQVDLHILLGDDTAAAAHARIAVEAAERLGTASALWSSYTSLGRALLLQDNVDDAIAALEHALSVMRQSGTGFHVEPLVLAPLAEALLAAGATGAALAAADNAVDSARTRGIGWLVVRAELGRSRVRRGAGATDAALAEENTLRGGLAVLEETGYALLEPEVRVELAALARLRGDDATAGRELAAAQELYGSMGAVAPARSLV